MSGMNGDYQSMAEAVGEAPWQLAGYEPSHVITGADLAEAEAEGGQEALDAIMLVTERDRARTVGRLERENSRLRERIADLEGADRD